MKNPLINFFLTVLLFSINHFVLAMDLDGDGIEDQYSTSEKIQNQDEARVEIKSSRTGKTSVATLPLGRGGIVQGYFPETFDLYLEYYPENPDITVYSFEWSQEKDNWILDKISYWQDSNRLAEHNVEDYSPLLPDAFNVERIACCTLFSELSSDIKIQQTDTLQAKRAIDSDLKKLLSEKKDVGKSRKVPLHLAFEIAQQVDTENVRETNDLAYFLYLNNQLTSAALILKSIHEKFPDRTVATLNLADVYWKLNMHKEACPLYSDYVAKMRALGKVEKTPKAAQERAHCP